MITCTHYFRNEANIFGQLLSSNNDTNSIDIKVKLPIIFLSRRYLRIDLFLPFCNLFRICLEKDIEYGGGSYINSSHTDKFTDLNSAPFSIGLVMVGFEGHACFPSIKLSLSNQKDYNAVLNTSYLVCFTFYTSIAMLGYLMYGVNVDEEITFNIMNSVKGVS